MSPMTRYKIIFWIFTMPILPAVIVLTVTAVVLAELSMNQKERVYDWFDRVILKIVNWRNKIGIVKRSHDRAYLFEKLKSFD
jgi:hypothetical protein